MNNKSALFAEYNKARAAARSGKLDPNRVNRALGVLQMKDTRPYDTTINSCSCPDAQFGHVCKHRIAKMIERRAQERHPEPEQEIKSEYVAINHRFASGGAYYVIINKRGYLMVSPASITRLDKVIERYGKDKNVDHKKNTAWYRVVRLSGA